MLDVLLWIRMLDPLPLLSLPFQSNNSVFTMCWDIAELLKYNSEYLVHWGWMCSFLFHLKCLLHLLPKNVITLQQIQTFFSPLLLQKNSFMVSSQTENLHCHDEHKHAWEKLVQTHCVKSWLQFLTATNEIDRISKVGFILFCYIQ